MKDNVRDLLAGYATGTLSEAEKKALFEAALHDPELFAEIANEEPLREMLASPVARAELLERVAPAEPGFLERLAGWMRRPAVLSAVGVVAGLARCTATRVAISVFPHQTTSLSAAARNRVR